PLVYARLADTLRTQDLVRRGVDDELERHRARSRVVAGVVARVRVDDTDVATGRACTALAPPGGCGGQAEHPDDRRTEDRLGPHGTTGDRVRDEAAVAVGGLRERDERVTATDRITLHRDVADGEDRGVARALLLVDDDSAALPRLEARLAGET